MGIMCIGVGNWSILLMPTIDIFESLSTPARRCVDTQRKPNFKPFLIGRMTIRFSSFWYAAELFYTNLITLATIKSAKWSYLFYSCLGAFSFSCYTSLKLKWKMGLRSDNSAGDDSTHPWWKPIFFQNSSFLILEKFPMSTVQWSVVSFRSLGSAKK